MEIAKKFYRVNDPHNLSGIRITQHNREELDFFRYQAWLANIGQHDISKIAEMLCADGCAYGVAKTKLMLGFAYRLSTQMPNLLQHALALGHINSTLACAIERALQDLPADAPVQLVTTLERRLVHKLTAVRANQTLPTPRSIQHWIEQQLCQAAIVSEPLPPKPPAPNYCILPSTHPEMALITAELDAVDIEEIEQNIVAYAKACNISKIAAFKELLCGDDATRQRNRSVIIVGVGGFVSNVPLQIEQLQHTTKLTANQQQHLLSMGPKYCNALGVATIMRKAHHPNREQRAVVQLRDGYCRFPGCRTQAKYCDVDHVINHEAGGWTTLSNLQCLCREHHNMKTDRRVSARMQSDGAVHWYDPDTDSSFGTTHPEGPLAGIQGRTEGITTRHSGKTEADDNSDPPIRNGLGRWGATWEQRNRRIRDERNAQRKPPDFDMEPPPF